VVANHNFALFGFNYALVRAMPVGERFGPWITVAARFVGPMPSGDLSALGQNRCTATRTLTGQAWTRLAVRPVNGGCIQHPITPSAGSLQTRR